MRRSAATGADLDCVQQLAKDGPLLLALLSLQVPRVHAAEVAQAGDHVHLVLQHHGLLLLLLGLLLPVLSLVAHVRAAALAATLGPVASALLAPGLEEHGQTASGGGATRQRGREQVLGDDQRMAAGGGDGQKITTGRQ